MRWTCPSIARAVASKPWNLPRLLLRMEESQVEQLFGSHVEQWQGYLYSVSLGKMQVGQVLPQCTSNVLFWKQMAKLVVAFTQRRDMRRHPTDRLSQQLITTRTVTQIHRSSLQNSQPLLCQQSPCPCMSQAPRLNGYPHRVQADFSLTFFRRYSASEHGTKTNPGRSRFNTLTWFTGQDILADDLFESLLLLASSGRIGAALAAPYCSKHSWATLRSLGPSPRSHTWAFGRSPTQYIPTTVIGSGECYNTWPLTYSTFASGSARRYCHPRETIYQYDLGWSTHVSMGQVNCSIRSPSLRLHVGQRLGQSIDVCLHWTRYPLCSSFLSSWTWWSRCWSPPSRWFLSEQNQPRNTHPSWPGPLLQLSDLLSLQVLKSCQVAEWRYFTSPADWPSFAARIEDRGGLPSSGLNVAPLA